MTERRDPVLVRLAQVDPAADDRMAPSGVMDAASLLDLVEERIGTMTDTEQRGKAERGRRWRGPALAAAMAVIVVVAVGVFALVAGGSGEELAAPAWTEGTPSTSAQVTAPIAPTGSPAVNQGAVFDERAGRVVYVDGEGATWAFDVGTNTWEWLHAAVPGFEDYAAGDLVYDVDSDRTVGIDFGSSTVVNVFDASSGEWTWKWTWSDYWVREPYPRGAVYDPVSGLVVVASHEADRVVLNGYDVETDEWTELGSFEEVWDGGWAFLVGYSSQTDELVFHGGYAPEGGDPLDTNYDATGPTTVLYGLRSGETTVLPGGPSIFSPWGAWYPYASGVDGAVLVADGGGATDEVLHRFDAATGTWEALSVDPAAGPGVDPDRSELVYDPINERLVVVYSLGDVWAVDLDTGEWTALLDVNRLGG